MPIQSEILPFPQNNLTWQILHAATAGGYGVGAYNCYNTDGVMAVIRAAERKQSPAIIQIFPFTMHFQGKHFIEYVVNAAHAASVPIAVHLDHCTKPEDVEEALTLPFDSIMVDASTFDPEENVAYCRRIVEIAKTRGITIEAEMGRIEGGEDGLPTVDMEALFTDPATARHFLAQTGVHFLAPSFGNIHGPYPSPGGAKDFWQLDRVDKIRQEIPSHIPIVLHGAFGISDELLRIAVSHGFRKINLNKKVRDNYTAFIAENAGTLELTELKMQGVEIYARGIEAAMDVLGSSNRASKL